MEPTANKPVCPAWERKHVGAKGKDERRRRRRQLAFSEGRLVDYA